MRTAPPLLLLLMLLCPASAQANIPLPTVLAFNLPLWMGLGVFGALFAGVVLVETAALVLLYRREWRWSLGAVFRANLLSTVMGALLTFHMEVFTLWLVPLVAALYMASRFQWSARRRYRAAFGMMLLLLAVIIPWPTLPGTIAQLYVTLVVAFGLSVLFESFILAPEASGPRQALRWSLGTNAVSYCVLLLLMFFTGIRSGAFAVREWHVWQIASPGHVESKRGAVISRLEEFYLWEKSDTRGGVRSAISGGHSWYALQTVVKWAEDGDTRHARELYDLIRKHNTLSGSDSYEQDLVQRAEKALGLADDTTSDSVSRSASE